MQETKEELNRQARLHQIRLILDSMRVENQSELLELLRQQGFSCTQATLSRDFRQMHVIKRRTASGKRYYSIQHTKANMERLGITADEEAAESETPGYGSLDVTGFQSIAFSGNMAVIKTLPGYASSVAYHIDDCNLPEILGTIAGDDTIFCVMREDTLPVELIHKLNIQLNKQ